MNEVGSTAALALAAIFAWAGLAKGLRPARTAASFRDLGVPAASFVARALPIAELVLAAALVVRPRSGGVLALFLLAVFSIWLRRSLQRGSVAGCGCFGGSQARPASVRDLLRNVMLGVLGLLATAAPVPVGPSLPSAVTVSSLVLLGALLLGLADLRLVTGRVWDIHVEAGPGGIS